MSNFQRTQRYHKTNTLSQEMMILRNAFLTYYEMQGGFPDITLAALTDDSFADIKPYWYPFHPESSKVIEHKTSWSASTSKTAENTYLRLVSTENLNLKIEEIAEITRNVCKVVIAEDGKTCDFYILQAFEAI